MPVAGMYTSAYRHNQSQLTKQLNVQRAKILFNAGINAALGQGGATTSTIWNYLNSGNRYFDIVILDATEKFGQMVTDQDLSSPEADLAKNLYKQITGLQTLGRPVVLWNPNYVFEYYGNVNGVILGADGEFKLAPNNTSNEYVWEWEGRFGGLLRKTVVRVTRGEFPPWVTLFHELGHTKQYFEWGGASEWNRRLNVDASWGQLQIDADNLERHEHPICNHLDIPIRTHYKHNAIGFEKLKQMVEIGQGVGRCWLVAESPAERTAIDGQLAVDSAAQSDPPHYRRNP